MSFSIGMVSARGACPCLLIQTKQHPLVLRDKPMEFIPTWGNLRAISVLIPGWGCPWRTQSGILWLGCDQGRRSYLREARGDESFLCAFKSFINLRFFRGTRPWDSEISVSAFQALPVHHFTHPIHPFRGIHLRTAAERTTFHIRPYPYLSLENPFPTGPEKTQSLGTGRKRRKTCIVVSLVFPNRMRMKMAWRRLLLSLLSLWETSSYKSSLSLIYDAMSENLRSDLCLSAFSFSKAALALLMDEEVTWHIKNPRPAVRISIEDSMEFPLYQQ